MDNQTLPPEQNEPAVVKFNSPWLEAQVRLWIVSVHDAMLFAAAPDMLAALKSVYASWMAASEDFFIDDDLVARAIAKAEGAP
jgi:hypothetical protein